MATGTLVDHSLGLVLEAAWDTAKAPDHFYEWLETSGMDLDPNVINAKGLRVGSRFPRQSRRVGLVPKPSGKLQFEVASKGFGLPLQCAFGTAVSTNVSGALYQQLFTATTTGSLLPTFTATEGIVEAGGTIDAYTWRGCTVKTAELQMPTNGLMTLKLDVDARHMHATRAVSDGVTTSSSPTVTSATGAFAGNDVGAPISGTGIPTNSYIGAVNSATSVGLSSSATVNTPVNATGAGTGVAITIGTAYVSPTYPASPSTFSSAVALSVPSVQIGGTFTAPTTTALATVSGGTTALSVKDFTLTLDNGLDTGRDVIGGRNQATTGTRSGKLKTTVEYDSTTGVMLRDAMINQTPLALILTAQTPEYVTAGNPATVQIAVPVAQIDKGAIPQPTLGKVVTTSVEWTVLDGLVAASALYAVIRTADTAI